MKLSDLKLKKISRKMIFNDNKTEVVDDMKVNGEVSFYSIDESILTDIHNTLKDGVEKEATDNEVAFGIIPHICDIEVDVTVEEFSEMLETPSKQLMDFMSFVLESMKSSLDMIKTLSNIEKNVSEVVDLNPKVSKENLLNELYLQLTQTEDRETKIQLLSSISKLETELSEIE
jgi:hypothetical protein